MIVERNPELNQKTLLHTLEGEILAKNRKREYTVPSYEYYPRQWLWDSCFAAHIYNSRGEPEYAAQELTTLLRGVDPTTGFLANMQFHDNPRRFFRDFESHFYNHPKNRSSNTQPPLMAWAAWDTYEAFQKRGEEEKGLQLLQDIYGGKEGDKSGLVGAYTYFDDYRRSGVGHLIGILHPYESGRDSDPSIRGNLFQLNGRLKERFPKTTAFANMVFDAADVMSTTIRASNRKWDPQRMKDVYWVTDVMFNALYANNLNYMARISEVLGDTKAASDYAELSRNVEADIIRYLWNQTDGIYYNLDADGNQNQTPSITSLFALLLPTLPQEHLERLSEKMRDKNWYGTPYLFPCVPANSPTYEPYFPQNRLWKTGEIWINTNMLLGEEGLVSQVSREDLPPELRGNLLTTLRDLATDTEMLVNNDLLRTGTVHECFGGDGRGYRISDFTWSLGGRHMNKSKALLGNHSFAY